MRVALGTFEVTDEERKRIKRALGFKAGKASRREVREFALRAAETAVWQTADPEDLIAKQELEKERE